MSKDTSGSAFPSGFNNGESGMTLREYFAAKVDLTPYKVFETLQSKLDRTPSVGEMADYIAAVRYTEADAMLAERAK